MELFITTTGLIRALYDEAIPVHAFGTVQITRASHVEPDADANWWADLAPQAGPVLGPFPQRRDALRAEQDWLTHHVLCPLQKLSLERPDIPLCPTPLIRNPDDHHRPDGSPASNGH